MEIGLNFLWLLLAVAAFLLWGREAARPASRRHALKLATLGCALALLFPVISVTDDLHAQQAVMEDSNPAKRVLKAAGYAPAHSAKVRHSATIGATCVFALPGLEIVGRLNVSPVRTPGSLSADPYRSRAPPSPRH